MPELTMPRAEAAMLETISDTGIFQRRINKLLEVEERVSKKLDEYNYLVGVIDAEEKAKQKVRDADDYHASKTADIKRQQYELETMHNRLAAENQTASEKVKQDSAGVVQAMEEIAVARESIARTQRELATQAAEVAEYKARLNETMKEYVQGKAKYVELCNRVVNFLKGLEAAEG